MSEVYKRTITGIGIVGVIVGSVAMGRYTFFALCCALSLSAVLEFYRLTAASNKWPAGAGILLSASLLLTSFLHISNVFDWRILLVNLPLISCILFTALLLKSNNSFTELALIFLGQVYVTLPFIILYQCAFSLDENFFNANLMLGYFLLLWANDTGAYVFGSLFGKNKLAPVISPKKTWEGSAGGAFCVAVIVCINGYFFADLSLVQWIVLGIIVIVMGTLGDLTKSVLKRNRNVKDSGSILPGHGGILDRFDSLIGSVPWVYTYLSISGPSF
jgi:phosphatidate cytidylyltransferase